MFQEQSADERARQDLETKLALHPADGTRLYLLAPVRRPFGEPMQTQRKAPRRGGKRAFTALWSSVYAFRLHVLKHTHKRHLRHPPRRLRFALPNPHHSTARSKS
ncbi:protein of unknown function [Paraburkholderia kururiensis]